jgi:hypothetical protein
LPTGDRDLKVSIGTGESNGPATTWHVVTSSSSSQKKSGKPDFREEIVLDASKQLNKKIYFLATGNGCSTLQVNMHSYQLNAITSNLKKIDNTNRMI